MSQYEDENILVVPRALLDDLGAFQGLSTDVDRYLDAFLDPANNFFMPRADAEDDPSHKQIIPYAIFHHNGRFLHYVRGKKSGEQRLASKGSIGIGGHINQDDAHNAKHLEQTTYMTGVDREVNEELKVETTYTQQSVALINDDSNDVGQVHIGVVHLFDLASDAVAANEANIANLEFLSVDELRERHDALETWSQHCLTGLEGWTR